MPGVFIDVKVSDEAAWTLNPQWDANVCIVARSQGLAQVGQVVLRDPQGEHLPALEADRRSSRRHAWSSASP